MFGPNRGQSESERRKHQNTLLYNLPSTWLCIYFCDITTNNVRSLSLFEIIRNAVCVCVCSRERVLRCEGVKTNAFFQIYSEWNSKSSLTEHNMCAMGQWQRPKQQQRRQRQRMNKWTGAMDGIGMAENHAANTTIKWEKRVMNNNTIFNMHRNWDVTCRARHTLHENDLLPFVYVILYARISSSVWVQPKKNKNSSCTVCTTNTHFVWHWNAAGGV